MTDGGLTFQLFCAFFYIPFYFVAVRFASPTQAGINLFPISCLLVPGSIVVSALTSRLGQFRWAIWAGWVLMAAGCGLLNLLDVATPTAVWAAALAVLGVGNGMVLTGVNVATQAVAAPRDSGAAAACYAAARTLGMAVGVAVGGTTFQNAMAARLRAEGLPAAIARNAEAFAARRLPRLAPADPLRAAALDAYVQGFRAVFWVLTGAAVAGFLVSLLIRHHSMDKALESDFVLAGGGREPGMTTMMEKDAPESRFSEDSCDLTPLLPGQRSATGSAAASAYWAPTKPYGELHPVTVMRPIERAPAFSFYIAASGRRMPFDMLADRRKRAAALDAARRDTPRAPPQAHHTVGMRALFVGPEGY